MLKFYLYVVIQVALSIPIAQESTHKETKAVHIAQKYVGEIIKNKQTGESS